MRLLSLSTERQTLVVLHYEKFTRVLFTVINITNNGCLTKIRKRNLEIIGPFSFVMANLSDSHYQLMSKLRLSFTMTIFVCLIFAILSSILIFTDNNFCAKRTKEN